MKKVLLVALAVLMGTMTFAQKKGERMVSTDKPIVRLDSKDAIDNVQWDHIATPFVANDIYGNEVSLQNYLDSGKCVIIDYSCTWCGPCWNMHLSGMLEQFDAMQDVQVIWVECESRNTTAQIYGPQGGSSYSDMTYGNWTVTANGDSIEYPIIDDDAAGTCMNTCISLYQGYVPTLFFIAPNGYFCDLNIANSLVSYNDISGSIANIQALMQRYPRSGDLPTVSVNGPSTVIAGNSASFSANYFSVDEITSVAWTMQGATPATATGANATCTWDTPGTYNVSVTVTNANGTATADITVTVTTCDPLNLPFTCGFEASDNLGCWQKIDQDGDGYNWDEEFWNGSDYVHSGSGAIGTASYINNIGILSPDNWLITPQLIIPAGGATLEYYVGGVGQMYGDKYSIYVSTTGSAISDFGEAIFTDVPTSDSFTKKTVSLAAYAGQTIYIAFRHYDISDGYWLIFDDMSVTSGAQDINGVAMPNVSMYPNPTTGVFNISAEGLQQVEVVDLNGRVVMNERNANTIDMSELSNGVYFVRVITNAGVATQKIVKK